MQGIITDGSLRQWRLLPLGTHVIVEVTAAGCVGRSSFLMEFLVPSSTPVPADNLEMKVIGDFMNTTTLPISAELEDSWQEEQSLPGELTETEIATWKAAFHQIGWMEEIGPDTRAALSTSKDQYGLLTEPLLCVTYVDNKGSRLTGFWFNRTDLLKPFSCLIATSKRLMLVDPENQIVRYVEYENINKIEQEMRGNIYFYTLLLECGDSIHLRIRFTPADDETIVDRFFERIATLN